MTGSIALVDYGAGNLASVRKGFIAAGADLYTPQQPEDLMRAGAVVIPGVGHFGATTSLSREWRGAILERIDSGVPLFGICLGMQWLFEGSTEANGIAGLGLIAGNCSRIDAPPPLKVPHVGWNTLQRSGRPGALLRGIGGDAHVYFTHTYAAPVTAECTATCTHGTEFAAVVERDHVCGVQFHPEKSGSTGLQILRNFVETVRR